MGGGVAWFAHIGGFLAGILFVWLEGLAAAPALGALRKSGPEVDFFPVF